MQHIMEDTTLARLMAILSEMPGPTWDDTEGDKYYTILYTLDEPLAYKLAEELIFHHDRTRRPGLGELAHIIARIASVRPDAEQVYAEIMYLVSEFGEYGVRAGNLRMPGDPPFSHPLVERVVRSVGGWQRICNWDEKVEGALHRRVVEAHKSANDLWQREVISQLRAYPEERNPVYFSAPLPLAPARALSPAPGRQVQGQRQGPTERARTALALVGVTTGGGVE